MLAALFVDYVKLLDRQLSKETIYMDLNKFSYLNIKF